MYKQNCESLCIIYFYDKCDTFQINLTQPTNNSYAQPLPNKIQFLTLVDFDFAVNVTIALDFPFFIVFVIR